MQNFAAKVLTPEVQFGVDFLRFQPEGFLSFNFQPLAL